MLEFTVPFPPSVNSYWRHVLMGKSGVRTLLSARGRQYQRMAVAEIKAQIGRRHPPLSCPVAIELEYRKPDNRRRDLDNLQKAVLDAITHAGVWLDDSQVHELHSAWSWRNPASPGCVNVKIWERGKEDA